MYLTDLSTVKSLLQISVATYDTLITLLLPKIQSLFIQETANIFQSGIYLQSSTINFKAGTPAVIEDLSSDFTNTPFLNDMSIYIKGSLLNDGFKKVKTVVATSLTLDTGETLIDEDQKVTVVIHHVQIPDAIHLLFADIINLKLDTTRKNVKSETTGKYSITYKDLPTSLQSEIDVFRKLKYD